MIWSSNKGWIGVDLGSHTVKLAQLEKSGGKIQLAEALILRRGQPWPGGDEGSAVEPIESSEEIRAALSLGAGFSGRTAAVVLPMSVCDVRECQIPADPDRERGTLVAEQLDSAYGNALETREFGYWPIDLSPEPHPTSENLIALSIDHSWAAQIARDMTEAGLVGRVLDGLPLALARAVKLGGQVPLNEPVAAVDWGCQRATLCIVVNGRPYFVRCLRGSGFANVIDALCKSLSVTREEAQKLLADHGLPNRKLNICDDLQAVIEEVIAEPLNTFVEELTRTVTFLGQQRRSLSPTRLVLFGGGAAIKNAAEFLFDKIDVPAEPWRLRGDWSKGHSLPHLSIELMGPAIALSSLAWAKS